MTYAIIILLGIIVGLLCGGYVSAVIGGLKTDVALIRTKALNDFNHLHARISEIEHGIASKLP
jgi:hypothetical protein